MIKAPPPSSSYIDFRRRVNYDPVNDPKVVVVIPYLCNGKCHSELERCLKALLNQSLPLKDFCVAVVENGPHRTSEDFRRQYSWVTWIYSKIMGSYRARNLGILSVSGRHYAFTDADCTPHPDWLANGLRHLQKPNIIIGGSIQLINTRNTFFAEYDALTAFPQEYYVSVRRFAATANVITSRTVLESIGLFLPQLSSGGDQEWCQRAFLLGIQLEYADDVVVGHPTRSSLRSILGKIKRTTRGQVAIDLRSRKKPRPFFSLHRQLSFLNAQVRSTQRQTKNHSHSKIFYLFGIYLSVYRFFYYYIIRCQMLKLESNPGLQKVKTSAS